jgi:hypothetical protein
MEYEEAVREIRDRANRRLEFGNFMIAYLFVVAIMVTVVYYFFTTG